MIYWNCGCMFFWPLFLFILSHIAYSNLICLFFNIFPFTQTSYFPHTSQYTVSPYHHQLLVHIGLHLWSLTISCVLLVRDQELEELFRMNYFLFRHIQSIGNCFQRPCPLQKHQIARTILNAPSLLRPCTYTSHWWSVYARIGTVLTITFVHG